MTRLAEQLLTVCIAVLTLGALAPVSASAIETGWMVGGTQLSGSAELASTARVDENSVLTVAGFTLTCSGSTLNGTMPQIESPSSASAKSLEFTGCSTSSPCSLAGANAGGVISTLPVTAAFELKSESASAVLATFSPKSGTTFTTIAFTGSGCALSGKQSVNGKVLVEGPTGQEEKTAQKIKAITTQASGLLKLGSSNASLTGAALLKLKSEKAWSFLAEPEKEKEKEKEKGWMVGGTQLSGSAELATTAALDSQTKIKSDGTTIACEGKTLNAVAPEIKSPSTGAAKELEFTGCQAEAPCSISSTKIGTEPISIEATTSGASAVVQTLKPTTGSLLAVVKYEGETCALDGTQNITGTLKLEAPHGQEERTVQQFNSITGEGSGELKVDGRNAAIEASVLLKLKNEKTWSFLAEPEKEKEKENGWMVGGTQLSGSAELATTARVDESSVLRVAGVTLTCSGSTLNGTAPHIESPSSASASALEFTGCAASSPCTLTGSNSGGVVGTLPVMATVELKSGSTKAVLATFLPKMGSTFATIAFTGAGCAFSGKQPVNGKALVEGPTGQEEKVTQEIMAITTEASGLLKVGSSAASLTGAALLKLKSENTWSLL